MADRTQLKAAANNHIADDDPFAELTRIMGFDPRQPVRPQAPGGAKAAAPNQAAEEADFDIDLEKELMGEFDAVEESAPAAQQAVQYEPAYEAAKAALTDDELAASFEQDFVFDDAADHAHFATPRAPEPAAETAFDDDFDKAVAGSLDVSPLQDDLSIDQEMAASLDEGFRIEHDEPDADHAAVGAAESGVAEPAAEAAFDADFDNVVQMSLEDELAFDDREVEQPEDAHVQPLEAGAAADQPIADEDFDSEFDQAHLDQAIADDLDQPQDLILEQELSVDNEQPTAVENEQPQAVEELQTVEEPVEVAHFAADPEPVVDPEPVADHEAGAGQILDDDFELSFRDALAEEPEAPAVDAESVADHEAATNQVLEDDFELNFGDALAEEVEVPAVEPDTAAEPSFVEPAPVAPVPPVAAVEPAKPAETAGERSLEDELNALLGAMTARPVPAAPAPVAPTPVAPVSVAPISAVQEPAPAPQPASYTGQQAADDLDWDLDQHEPARNEQTARPADADLDTLLAGELDQQGIEDIAAEQDAEPSIDFDDEAFDAAFAKGIEQD
ncbi:MAG: hypothetical protein E5W93_12315, partial [Mesorhizobium sp.]